MTTRDVLLSAADLVERGWSQRAFARDSDGDIVPVLSPYAASFCAYGALCRVAHTSVDFPAAEGGTVDLAARALSTVTGSTIIAYWNDRTSRTAAEGLSPLLCATPTTKLMRASRAPHITTERFRACACAGRSPETKRAHPKVSFSEHVSVNVVRPYVLYYVLGVGVKKYLYRYLSERPASLCICRKILSGLVPAG